MMGVNKEELREVLLVGLIASRKDDFVKHMKIVSSLMEMTSQISESHCFFCGLHAEEQMDFSRNFLRKHHIYDVIHPTFIRKICPLVFIIHEKGTISVEIDKTRHALGKKFPLGRGAGSLVFSA